MWLTLMWHVGSGLPWDWLTGPSDFSERGHMQEMLSKLPENSLITADAAHIPHIAWATTFGLPFWTPGTTLWSVLVPT